MCSYIYICIYVYIYNICIYIYIILELSPSSCEQNTPVGILNVKPV